MNTNNETAPGVKLQEPYNPAQQLTESAIQAWLVARIEAAGLSTSGPGRVRLQIASVGPVESSPNIITAIHEGNGFACAVAPTISEVLTDLKKQIRPPAELAAEKRKQAARLENEAALLELEVLNANSKTVNVSSNQ